MKEWLKKLINKKLYQVRSGEITITRYAHKQMEKYGLNIADIKDAWQYGQQEEGERVVRQFSNYAVILIVRQDGEEQVLTNCWKRKSFK